MAKAKGVLAFDLRISVEGRDGYFAAITKPFAITTYGDTAERAEQRALQAVELLLNSKTDKEKAIDFLNKRGVKHIIYGDGEPERHHPIIRERRQEIRVLEYAC